MFRTARSFIRAGVLALATIAAASFALAQSAQSSNSAPQQQPQFPPGVSAEQLQACIDAGTPGEQHKLLARTVGVWHGKTQMYFGPNTQPAPGTCTWTVTSIYEGRYVKAELDAELPGFGGFTGIGYAGFDNVSHKFVGTWLDSHSTGIMNGTATLSSDESTLNWTYNTNCPITRKPSVIREVQTITGPNTMTFEMFSPDPTTGKEYKCMHIDFTRQS